jgi:PAS domain S-box-containing protein
VLTTLDTPGVLLEAVVASAMDAVVALDEDQRIVLFNPAAEAMFGCPATEALGRPLDRILPKRFRAVHRRHVAGFAATGGTARSMGHLRPLAALRADGEEFPIEATISRVEIGGRLYLAAIVRDITARQHAEAARAAAVAREVAARAEGAAAAEQRDSLREILDGLPIGVFILAAPDAHLEFANAAFVDLVHGAELRLGSLPAYGRDFALLRADGSPLPAAERPGLRALRGERVQNQQLLLECADGTRLPVAAHAAPLREGRGTPERAIVVVQDVTQARQAEQLKDDFLALVSHELRTPLTAIHGGARLLSSQGEQLDPADRAELLADVVAESERLDQLLGNLLSLTAVMAGRLRAATEPVLVAPLARRVAAEVAARSPAHEFVVDVPVDLPPVEADPALLEQVLRNLYENAVKYAPDGGPVRTTATQEGESVVIHVADQGLGIAPEHVATVFERFRRVGGDPTVRGMGLGLYLSRILVEAQGGRIAASSPGPGRGTTMTVTLPLAHGWADGDDEGERSREGEQS